MHKNLYSNQSYEQVNIKKYLEEIVRSLQLYTDHYIYTDIEEIMIDMKSAMNVGLIVNEAVTNAIEHAFDEKPGEIFIELKHIGNRCSLMIKDNGKGFDTEKRYRSLGLTLIKDLSTTLRNGMVAMDGRKGAIIRIYFDLKEYADDTT